MTLVEVTTCLLLLTSHLYVLPFRAERERVQALKQVHEMKVEKDKAEYLFQESERTCGRLAQQCEDMEREMQRMEREFDEASTSWLKFSARGQLQCAVTITVHGCNS